MNIFSGLNPLERNIFIIFLGVGLLLGLWVGTYLHHALGIHENFCLFPDTCLWVSRLMGFNV